MNAPHPLARYREEQAKSVSDYRVIRLQLMVNKATALCLLMPPPADPDLPTFCSILVVSCLALRPPARGTPVPLSPTLLKGLTHRWSRTPFHLLSRSRWDFLELVVNVKLIWCDSSSWSPTGQRASCPAGSTRSQRLLKKKTHVTWEHFFKIVYDNKQTDLLWSVLLPLVQCGSLDVWPRWSQTHLATVCLGSSSPTMSYSSWTE